LGLFGFGKKDAAKETGDSTKGVSRAWHKARDDSGARSGGDRSHFRSSPSWAPKKTSSGIPFTKR
jgi:hypothetical protein